MIYIESVEKHLTYSMGESFNDRRGEHLKDKTIKDDKKMIPLLQRPPADIRLLVTLIQIIDKFVNEYSQL